ncbi:MAG: CPBP family intramembrane metalloprotease [Oscillospiraceae bacterium]|nr:CPBP family intramembrane metalloprotease [Oscillospiraceae bacterium]
MKNITNKRLLIFGIITVIFLVIFSFLYYQNKNGIYLTLLMLTPMVSVILTRFITKEGTKHLYIKPKIKGNVKWYLIAYLATPFIAYFGAVVFFVFNPSSIDLLNSKFAVEAGITASDEYYKLLFVTIPLAIIINPIMALISCLGEEFAWRGYLLPKLCAKSSTLKAVILTSLIWGLWHTPIIAMGFNYGTSNVVLGVFSMVILCLVLGIIEAFLFFKTKSIWASVLFHAAVNGIDLWSPSALFMSENANPFIGPNLIGIVGGIGFIIFALVCLIAIQKNQEKFKLFTLEN